MVTTLVFIRHATPDKAYVGDDTTRPLSQEGEKVQHTQAHRLKTLGYTPDAIFCSPLLRAVQSAQIIAEVLPAPITREKALGNNFDDDRLLNVIKNTITGGEAVLFFVGHAPSLASFAERLVGEPCLPEGLPKSGAAIVTFDEEVTFGKGQLATTIYPN